MGKAGEAGGEQCPSEAPWELCSVGGSLGCGALGCPWLWPVVWGSSQGAGTWLAQEGEGMGIDLPPGTWEGGSSI